MIALEQWRALMRDERLPAAAVDLDAFDRNVRSIANLVNSASGSVRAAGGGPSPKGLRIATKSVRVPDLIRRVLDHGAPYCGLMCYSAEEVRALAEEGFDDFLLAYPTVQKSDLKALRETQDMGKRVLAVVDGIAGIRALAGAMQGAAKPFPLVIELDMSLRLGPLHLGVRRSPIREPEALAPLLEEAAKYSCLRISGLMGYEAQVAGVGDRNPFKRLMNPVVRLMRRSSVRDGARRREKFARFFERNGLKLEVFNGGGTGSLSFAAREPWLTELAAGSGFLCPHLFDYYSNLSLEPACFFALQAVRHPAPGFVTCQGGGYVASGEPGWDKVPRPHLPSGAKLVSMEGAGEVQTPLRISGAAVPAGDPVLFRHAKAGELAERFTDYLLVSGGRVTGRAKTYRGRGWCFF